ncbi:hypothetical protein BDW02DRAFT_499724 [Decorospora gaudefroyi]|uniref:DUF8035 domain-containing protein n=1 Tax=Decorospora gaudefroyi TaxID=184978 RepID=A0A6A5K8Y8_9PLEO|nr:hypothetical protein BDW02DRAFT_499724 [Decorospora gaudefroyi]
MPPHPPRSRSTVVRILLIHMAEVVGIIASALTVGECAAQLSLALFSVVQTLRNAPKEIADIAEEISLLAESLQTLADIIGAHQNLCKPALFKNTHDIILRYKQFDTEIKKLIDTPGKLAGLKWFINKPKAKGLLKKVEGIKTALVLELNIIRLAREELVRPHPNPDAPAQTDTTLRSNRFRKIVESAVQANRQLVESAQCGGDNSRGGQRRYTAAEVDVYKEGSFDTATWLYHLIFSPDTTPAPIPIPRARRLYQASVTDESHHNLDSRCSHDTASVPERASSTADNKAMIVWSRKTEPSQVVDRLLSSWTTLSSDQITLSSTRNDDDDWREGIMRMIEEAKEEHDMSFGQWELQNESADEDFIAVPAGVLPTGFDSNPTPRRPSTHLDDWTDRRQTLSDIDTREQTSRDETHVRWPADMPPTRPSRPRLPSRLRPLDPRRRAEIPRPVKAASREPESPRVRTIYSQQTDAASSNMPRRRSPHRPHVQRSPIPRHTNPFIPQIPPPLPPSLLSQWQEPYIGPHFPSYPPGPPRPPYFSADPQWPNRPPAAPPLTPPTRSVQSVEEQAVKADAVAKEKAVVAAIEKLLEERDQKSKAESNDPKYARLVQLLTAQQESDARTEREQTEIVAEEKAKHLQLAREKEDERLRHLECVIMEQREQQREMESRWREERSTMDQRAEKQVQEARDLAAKEIAAARSEKKAAQDALDSTKAETNRREQEKAEAISAEEQKKIQDNHKQQMQGFEDLFRAVQEQYLKPEKDSQRPVRRTRIAEGNRSVDVTEYSTTKRDPPMFTSFSPTRFFQDEISRFDIGLERTNDRLRSHKSFRESFRGSAASLQSTRTPSRNTDASSTTQKSQHLIVLPVRTNRNSPAISELQTSLARFGVDSVFEDPQDMQIGQLVPYEHDDTSEQVVRSTLFWEASVLSLGSELLLTMRRAGWKPAYTRISGRERSNLLLGSQPIHTYFFSPDYKPQFSSSITASPNESITIQKALVEEYALVELGFMFQATDADIYILDGRLTYSDIETLVERSFLMRENNYRRVHRQLQWQHAPSLVSTASVYTVDDDRTTCGDTDTESGTRPSAPDVNQCNFGDINRFRVFDLENSGRSAALEDEDAALDQVKISVESPSVVSSTSSKSNNPFRRHMDMVKERASLAAAPSPTERSIWDEPVAHQ